MPAVKRLGDNDLPREACAPRRREFATTAAACESARGGTKPSRCITTPLH